MFLLAWKKFKDYEKCFQQRPTVLEKVPKLHMDENDIDRYFAQDDRPIPTELPSVAPVVTSNTEEGQFDAFDDISFTPKEEKRQKKVIETANMTQDNQELTAERDDQPVVL